MKFNWIPCFLCKIDLNKYTGTGKVEIGENFKNVPQKFKTDDCPLCNGSGKLYIKPYKKNPWNFNRKRRDYFDEG